MFDKHADCFEELGVDVNNGLGDVYSKIQSLPEEKKAEIEADIQAVYADQPSLAVVEESEERPPCVILRTPFVALRQDEPNEVTKH